MNKPIDFTPKLSYSLMESLLDHSFLNTPKLHNAALYNIIQSITDLAIICRAEYQEIISSHDLYRSVKSPERES